MFRILHLGYRVISVSLIIPSLTLCSSPHKQLASDELTSIASRAVTIRNDVAPLDVKGERIDAHDGEILQAGGRFYWYGTAYKCGFTLNQAGTNWCGVRIYSSTDMKNWTVAGAVQGFAFDYTTPGWQSRCSPPRFGCFRPHVVYNPTTQLYVMWINTSVSDTDRRAYQVLTSPSPAGPFTPVNSTPKLHSPAGDSKPPVAWGDHALFVDRDGNGYIVYTVISSVQGNSHDLAVEALDPTFTTGTGRYVRLGLTMVEAPSMVYRSGSGYLIFYSDPACPYCSGTGTSYVRADSPLGPYQFGGKIGTLSCQGQPAAVNEIQSANGTLYIWNVDRWVSGPNGELVGNQYQANTYLAPLTFNPDGSVPAQPCLPSWDFYPTS